MAEIVVNPHAKIVEEDEEWIARMEEIEPQNVNIINPKVPAELGRITQEIIDKYFPEFKGINIRFTSTASGRSLHNWNIALNPDILENGDLSYRHTIAHELTHQICSLQGVLRGRSKEVAYLYDQQMPNGELQCEMWTFARHPDLVCHSYFFKLRNKEEKELLERLWEEDKEKYGEIYFSTNKEHFTKHKQHIHELSKQALLKRKEGMIKYLAWYREELRKIDIIGYGRSY